MAAFTSIALGALAVGGMGMGLAAANKAGKTPPPRDVYQEGYDTLKAQVDLAPDIYAAEANQYYGQPAYTRLELDNLSTYLRGYDAETFDSGAYLKANPDIAKQYEAAMAGGGGMTDEQVLATIGPKPEYNQRIGRADPSYGMRNRQEQAAWQQRYDTLKNAKPGDPEMTLEQYARTQWEKSGKPSGDWVTTEKKDGLYDIYGEAAEKLGDVNRKATSLQRQADVGDLKELGPQVREALRATNPEQYALLDEITRQAQEELTLGGNLSTEDQRMADQQVRAAYADRGRLRGNASVTAEVLNRYGLQEARKRERRDFAGQALGYNAALSTDPAMVILGRPSNNTVTTTGAMGQASSANTGPQWFDPYNNYSADLYNTNYNAKATALANKANAYSAIGGGMMSMAGSLGGAAIGACWVARAVYGEENARWREFRSWLLTEAPSVLRMAYIKHGPRWAELVKVSPRWKEAVREAMEQVLHGGNALAALRAMRAQF